jgi:hypothetical protein
VCLTAGCLSPRLRLEGSRTLIKSPDLHSECDLCRPWKKQALEEVIRLEYELERRQRQ